MRLLVVLAATRALTPAPKPAAVTRRTAVAALALGGTLASPGRARRRNAAEQLRQAVFATVAADATVAGALLRLAFHDAVRRADGQTRGADGSIQYEIPDAENVRLGRPLALVMAMKPAGLSVADAVAVAGAAAVEASGGPRIAIGLGRLDASAAAPATLSRPIQQPGDEARDVVKRTLPEPGLSTVGLRRYFRRVGLSDQELVALMGAHTLGRHNTLLNMTNCLLYTSPSPRDRQKSRMPSSA